MHKAFKVTLAPNRVQTAQIQRTVGCARFVYNHFLARRKEVYDTAKQTLGYNACSAELTGLKKELTWLKEVDKFALQNALKNLDTAYKNFFDGLSGKRPRMGFPGFKKRHGSKQTYRTNLTNNNIQLAENFLKLPKLGWVKFRKSQEVTGRILSVTVTITKAGRYVASILCETEVAPYPAVDAAVGLDLGLKSYLTTSDAVTVENPKYYRALQRKLRRAHKKLSRCEKGSNNRAKAKTKLARVYEQVSDQREDFLHKLSTGLIRENAVIGIESLNIKGMVRNRKLSKSIMDAGWGMFVQMLEYKARWHGRTVQKIDLFFPSSQLCNVCGVKNAAVKDLSVREWVCGCSSQHDRDLNAALNIRNEALRLIGAAGSSDPLNACLSACQTPALGAAHGDAGIPLL
jgi:putative transposase